MEVQLRRIFREVFDDENLEVSNSLSPATLAALDSFAQVKLLIAVEEEFGVKFTLHEIASLNSVAALKKALSEKNVSV